METGTNAAPAKASSSGVSMPQKMLVKFASRRSARRSSYLAILRVASNANGNGNECRSCQAIKIGRLDAAKNAGEIRIAQIGQKVVILGDIEGRLEREWKRERMPLLPGDEMGDQLAHRAAVGDEVVVDEIDRGGKPASAHLVEFGDDLLRPLHARHAAVEARNIAELAGERAA